MCNEEDKNAVLQLMCLLSLTQSGIAKKYFDALRKEFLQSYGYEFLLMLSKLQDAGAASAMPSCHLTTSKCIQSEMPPIAVASLLTMPGNGLLMLLAP